MRIESSVTAISWIPSQAVEGMMKLPFGAGIAHYDPPPPDALDLEDLKSRNAFRFANELRAWVDVDGGEITSAGYSGGGHIGMTTLSLGVKDMDVMAVSLPDIQQEPQVGVDSVRFVQTCGGRTGVPAPRRVRRPPFIQLSAPLAWTTLALTIYADDRAEHELVGASPFPRHWIYDKDSKIALKSGLIDYKEWYRGAFGKHTPWGDEDSPALVTQVETALERELSKKVMAKEAKPKFRKLKQGKTLVEQGDRGNELFLLLDGVLDVEIDGEKIAAVGPGAILGERAIVEGGRRTATLRAATGARVAVVPGDLIDRSALAEVARQRRPQAKY